MSETLPHKYLTVGIFHILKNLLQAVKYKPQTYVFMWKFTGKFQPVICTVASKQCAKRGAYFREFTVPTD